MIRSVDTVAFSLFVQAPVGYGESGGVVPDDVPVTIKELDVEGAIREFRAFQERLIGLYSTADDRPQAGDDPFEIIERHYDAAGDEPRRPDLPVGGQGLERGDGKTLQRILSIADAPKVPSFEVRAHEIREQQ